MFRWISNMRENVLWVKLWDSSSVWKRNITETNNLKLRRTTWLFPSLCVVTQPVEKQNLWGILPNALVVPKWPLWFGTHEIPESCLTMFHGQAGSCGLFPFNYSQSINWCKPKTKWVHLASSCWWDSLVKSMFSPCSVVFEELLAKCLKSTLAVWWNGGHERMSPLKEILECNKRDDDACLGCRVKSLVISTSRVWKANSLSTWEKLETPKWFSWYFKNDSNISCWVENASIDRLKPSQNLIWQIDLHSLSRCHGGVLNAMVAPRGA